MVGDVGRDATVFADCWGRCGLAARRDLFGVATCFGATTVMPGSGVLDPVAVCDTAVPLRPHSNAIDREAANERAKKLGDILMAMFSQIPAE